MSAAGAEYDPDDMKAWIRQTRAAQGLPEHLEDPVGIQTIARAILNARRERAAAEAEQ